MSDWVELALDLGEVGEVLVSAVIGEMSLLFEVQFLNFVVPPSVAFFLLFCGFGWFLCC